MLGSPDDPHRQPSFATAPAPDPEPPPAPPVVPAVVVVPVAPPTFAHPVELLPTSNDAKGLGADVSRGMLAGTTLYGFVTALLHVCHVIGVVVPNFLGDYGSGIAALAAAIGGLSMTWLSHHAPPPDGSTVVVTPPTPFDPGVDAGPDTMLSR